MASEQLEAIVQILKARGDRAEMTVEESRAAIDFAARVFPTPEDVTREPAAAGGVPAEWISAPGADPGRTVYYLHGGGYCIGSIISHRELISRISRASGARALALDYRLTPEHPFPAAVEDALAGYRWLLANGTEPARAVIAGDSAGGGLTVATLVALRDAGDRLPAAAVCLSPWVDMEGLGESMRTKAEADPMIQREHLVKGAEMYLAGADPRHPLAAPLHADLSGLPPLLIQVGTSETLLDDSTRLAEKAKAAGVDVTLDVWDEMIHVFQFFATMLPEGRQAIDRIGGFIRERTVAGAAAPAGG